jgi:lipopolysaccharide transport system ATP-binding protein
MSNTVIRVQRLGKRYQIRHKSSSGTGLRHVLQDALVAPFRAIRKKNSENSAYPSINSSKEDLWALKEVSFEIERGEVVGIVGRNGAGKSTLLKVLSRITEPTTGRIEIDGRIASLLEIGTGFHWELTGRENIYLNGTILGMSRREIKAKFDEIVAFAETEKFLDTPVKHYSSGMYVRLAFAVAAHLEPEILIVDEVLAVGDIEFQKKCLGKMQDVSRTEGRTVLFVSHNMRAVASLCRRGVYLKGGRIQHAGEVRETIEKYVNDGNFEGAERIWAHDADAPATRNVRIHAVRLRSGGQVTADTMIDKEILVEIEYFSLRTENKLSAGIHLIDSVGGVVLSSANFPSACLNVDPWSSKPQPPGLYRSVCALPANFLNAGTYRINVLIMRNFMHIECVVEDALSFTVHDTGTMKQEYTGGWVGVVRPRFCWNTEQLGTDVLPEAYEMART